MSATIVATIEEKDGKVGFSMESRLSEEPTPQEIFAMLVTARAIIREWPENNEEKLQEIERMMLMVGVTLYDQSEPAQRNR